MRRFSLVIFVTAAILSGCNKDTITQASALYGTWVKEGGGLPADTLRFFSIGNKNMLAFEFSSTGGVNWPAHVETEYRFSNERLEVKAISGSDNFFPAESFKWITGKKEFSVKLYQIVQYISADYRVTYRKLD
jgi:hypothetical protein